MDLRAIQLAAAELVDPFVTCHDQIPANTEFPCAYVGLPTSIDVCVTLSGAHLVSMPITLCLSRVDDAQAQTQLSTLLSSGLLDALDNAVDPPWSAAQFTTVNQFRVVKFAGGDTEVIACDLNFTVRT